MTDHTKLRRKAEAATRREWVDEGWAEGHFGSRSEAEFVAAASPATVIALLDEIDALKRDAARYEYIRSTTTAIRDPRTGAREECTPELFTAAIDAGMIEAATKEKP